MVKRILLLFPLLFFTLITYASSKTWDAGGGDGLWSTAANWDSDIVPSGTDDITIPTGITVTLTSDYTTTGSLTLTGTGTIQMEGYNLTIGSLAASGSAVINNSGVAKILTVGSNNTSTLYAGTITNAIALTKLGSGTLTLSASNTYTGTTKIQSLGTLIVNTTTSLGTGDVNLYGGSLSVLIDGIGSNGTVSFSNNFIINSTLTGYLNVGNNGSNTGNTISFGTCNIGASSTLNITGSNGYNVQFATMDLLGGSAGTSIINPTTANIIIGSISTNGNLHTIQLDGTSTGNSITGIISGNTSGLIVSKTNSGTWTLYGANTYNGTTTISGGKLKLGAAGVIPNNSAVTVTSPGILDMNTFSETVGSIAGTGTIDNVVGAGTPTLTCGGDNTNSIFSGSIQNTTGSLTIIKSGSGTLTLSGANTNAKFYSNAGILSITNTNALQHQTYINGGTLEVLNNGSGNNGTITINTDLVVNSAYTGTINVANNGANTGNTVSFRSLNHAVATLTITGANNYSVTIPSCVLSGGGSGISIFNPTTANLLIGTITTSNAAHTAQLDGTSTGNIVSGIISDGSGFVTTLSKANTGTWTISGVNTFTGTTTITGGTLKLGAAGVIPDASAVTITSPGTLDMNTFSETVGSIAGSGTIDNVVGAGTPTLTCGGNNSTTIFSGVINNTTGVLAFTKVGSGEINITNSNLYSGVTSVNAGTLVFSNSGSLYNNGTAAGSIVVNNGGTIRFDRSDFMGTHMVIPVSTVTVNAGGTLYANGTYTTLYNLTLSGGSLVSNGGAWPTWGTFALKGTVTVNGTSTSTMSNNGGSPNFIHVGDNTNGGATTFNVAANCNPALVISTQIANAYQVDPNLEAISGIIKTGAGTMVLSGPNSYTGSTSINAGTLKLGASGVIPDASAVTVTGTLDMNTFSETVGSITGAGTIDNVAGAGTPILTCGGDGTGTTYSGIIQNTTGTLALTKLGVGTLILSGTNTYSGGTTISAGTLQIGAGSTTGILPGNVTNNATLTFNRSNAYTYAGIISGTGAVNQNGSGALTLQGANTYAGLTTIGATCTLIADNNTALGNTTGGTVLTAGASTYTYLNINGKTITGETVTLNTNSTGDLRSYFTSTGNSTWNGTITLAGTAGVCIVSNSGTFTIQGTINGSCSQMLLRGAGSGSLSSAISIGSTILAKTDAGAWSLNSSSNTWGNTTIVQGTLQLGINNAIPSSSLMSIGQSGAYSATFDLNSYNQTLNGITTGTAGSLTRQITNNGVSASTLTISSESNYSYDYLITDGTGVLNLVKAGSGIQTLSGTNTYSGTTNINAGTLKLNNTAALGTVAGATSVTSGAVLDLNGINYANAEPLTLNGTGITSGGALKNSSAAAATYGGLLTLGSSSSIIATSGNISLTNAGTITGATYDLILGGAYNGTLSNILATTSGSLTKQDAGIWTLSGPNTYTGTTNITAGTLKLGASGVIPDASAVTVTGTLDMNTFSETVGSITGAGTIDNIAGAGTPTLTCGGDGSNTSFSGLITDATGALSLIKTGSGTLILTGSNTYSGSTTISAGILQIGAGSTTGILPGNITNNATLTFNRSNSYTYSGIISGTGAVNQNGSGNLTLQGSNTYDGITTIAASSTLIADNNTALGSTSGGTVLTAGPNPSFTYLTIPGRIITGETVTLNSNTTGDLRSYLNASATSTWNGNITLAGTGSNAILSSTGTFTIQGTIGGSCTTLNLRGISNGIMNATISIGTSKIVKTDAGTWTLNANGNTWGATDILSGTIKLGITDAITTSSVILIGQSGAFSATLDLNSYNQTVGGLTTGSGGTLIRQITNDGATASTLTTNSTSNYSYDNLITDGTGVLNLVKAGSGTQTLSGTNTYSGTTTINAGTLKLNNTAALGTVAGATSVTSGAVLDLNGINYASVEPLTLNGTGITNGGALINSNAIDATYGGLLSLGSPSSIVATSGNISLINAGTITGATHGLTLAGSYNTSIASIIGTTTGTITKTGSGTLTLLGANTYTGLTTISGGILKLGSSTALGSIAAGTVVENNCSLDLNGQNYANAEALTIKGSGGVSNAGVIYNSSATPASFPGAISLADESTIKADNQITLSGTISNNQHFTKTGNNSLIFANNTVTVNNFLISAGTLDGATSTINIYGDFTGSGTFIPNANGVVFLGSGIQSIPSITFNNLTINNASGTTLTGDVMVSGTLTLTNGILDVKTHTLTTSSISGGSSSSFILTNTAYNAGVSSGYLKILHVGSNVNTLFPVGVSSSSYTPCYIQNSGTAQDFSVRVFSGVYTNGLSGAPNADIIKLVNRTWEITPTVQADINAKIQLQWNASDEGATFALNRTTASISKNRHFGGDDTWKAQVSDAISGTGPYSIVTSSGISTFSTFGVGIDGSTLPIELKTFIARKHGNNSNLDWTTSSEINNDFFSVERSFDGTNWTEIYRCDGAGTSTKEHRYSFIDNYTFGGINYYRLKQTDLDGMFSYSHIESVKFTNDSISMQIYPIPAIAEEINLVIKCLKISTATITITDIYGRQISKGEVEVSNNPIIVKLADICTLNPGSYFITMSNNNMIVRKKIIVE